MLETLFAEGKIDIYPRNGKSGGAFCMGVTPGITPYLLLNYTANLRDIATLAHELGHALHFMLARKQTLLNYHAPLPLAETASVFGEMLLTREMLANETDKGVHTSLLCARIEDIIATTFRQTVLTRFEERLHHRRRDGLLSDDEICRLWLEENGKLFGDAVEMIDCLPVGVDLYIALHSYALLLLLLHLCRTAGAGALSGVPAQRRRFSPRLPGDLWQAAARCRRLKLRLWQGSISMVSNSGRKAMTSWRSCLMS